MKHSSFKLYSAFLFIIFFSTVFSQDVVKWQNGSISLEEFEHDMLLYAFYNDKENAENSSMEIRRKHLRGMIMKELIMQLAEDLKIDTVKTLKEAYNGRLYAIAIVQKLLVDSVRNKFFSEQDIKDTYFKEMISSGRFKPFELERSGIIKSLISKNSDKYNEEYNNFIIRLFKRYRFKINTLNLEIFIDLYNKYSKIHNAPENDPLDYFNENQLNTVLASYDSKKYLLNDLTPSIRTININQRIKLNDLESVKSFIMKYHKKILLRMTVDNLGYTKTQEIKEQAKLNMIFDYKNYFINTIVRSKLPNISYDEYLNYYNNNSNKFIFNGELQPLEVAKWKIKSAIEKPHLQKLETLWEEDLFNEYKIEIDQLLLENSFNYSLDLRK